MNRLQLMLLLIAIPGCVPGSAPLPQPPVASPPAKSVEQVLTITYLVPAEQPEFISSAPKWGLAAPIENGCSDPNQIVYDTQHLQAFLEWADRGETVCGIGSYRFVTPEGEIAVRSGLDEFYLGTRFRSADLLQFLGQRLDGPKHQREFVVPAEFRKKTRLIEAISQTSPWERDTRTVISLLSLGESKRAYPYFKRLLDDPSPPIRHAALLGLGSVASVVPEATNDIERMLDNPELSSDAARALALSGENGVPVMIRALDHQDPIVWRHILSAIRSMHSTEAAVRCLVPALRHPETEVRVGALQALQEILSKKVPIQNPELIPVLEQWGNQPPKHVVWYPEGPVSEISPIAQILETLKAQQRDLPPTN